MSATVISTNLDGFEFSVFKAQDFEGPLAISKSILQQGWRLVAIYEVMVPMTEYDIPSGGVGVSRNVLRPEARFLCSRGERGDLVEGLERQLEAQVKMLSDATAERQRLMARIDDLERQARRSEEQQGHLSHNLDATRERAEKAEARLQAAREHHRQLEVDFGKVRAALGEISLKKILTPAEGEISLKKILDPKVPT